MERHPQSVNLTDRIEWWWYLLGAVLPIVGAIAGIVFMAKSKIGPAIALWATSFLAFLVWSGVFTLVQFSSAVDDASTDTSEIVAAVVPSTQEDDSAPATNAVAQIDQPEGFQDCGAGVYAKDNTTTCPFALNVYEGFNEETAENVPAVVQFGAHSEALGKTVYVVCEYPEDEVTCQSTRGAEIRFAVPS